MSSTNFGNLLRRLRKDKGLYLWQMATELDISLAYVCDLENGRRDGTLKICKKINLKFGCDIFPFLTAIFQEELLQNDLNYNIWIEEIVAMPIEDDRSGI